MSVEFKPISKIVGRFNLEPDGTAQWYFTIRCKDVMEQYVPMRDKNLRNTADTIDSTHIMYPMPYAHYQYKGIREDGTHEIKHWTTPGTGPYWDERFKSANLEDVVKETEEFIKREAKPHG